MVNKSIQFFGTNNTAFVASSNGTISTVTLSENANWANLDGKLAYSKANVIINFPTLISATTGATMIISIQERFSGAGFIETASSSIRAIKQGTQLILTNAVANNLNGSTVTQLGSFPALGNGIDKQVVFTMSTIQTISADVYWTFYKD